LLPRKICHTMAARGGAAGEGGAITGWVDPFLLDKECEDCVCALCFGVMMVPSSGCPGGHCFCLVCYRLLLPKGFCPAGAATRSQTEKLVRIRAMEGMIQALRCRCENAAGEEGIEAAGALQKDCRWRGCVGQLAAHLQGECGWAPVPCPNQGCAELLLRKDLLNHDAICGERKVPCRHCKVLVACRAWSLAEHEDICFI